MRLSDRVWFWGFLCAIGALVLLDVGIATGKDASWWSAWGQWAGAVGSVAAAGVAVWIAIAGWRRSDQQARELQEREAASKFGAWIEFDETSDADPKVQIINSGAQPVYNVTLYFDFPVLRIPNSTAWAVGDYDTDVYGIGTIGPRDAAAHDNASAYLARKLSERLKESLDHAPFQTDSLGDVTYTRDALVVRQGLLDECRLTIRFRDSNGIKWVRGDRGDLFNVPVTEFERMTQVEVPPSLAEYLREARPHGQPWRP